MKVYSKVKKTIFLTEDAFFKINAMVKESSQEIGCVGTVKKHKDGYVIEDIYIPKQKVNAATCELDPDDLIQYAMSLPDPNSVRCWIHSHVNMPASPSGQDEKQIEELSEGCDYFIAGIHNKKGETRYVLYEGEYIFDEMPVRVFRSKEYDDLIKQRRELDEKMVEYDKRHIETEKERAKKEISEKCKTLTYTTAYKPLKTKTSNFEQEIVFLDDEDDELRHLERNLEGAYDECQITGVAPLHEYFTEWLALDEIFTYTELAEMAMTESAKAMGELITNKFKVIHEWTEKELDDIWQEVIWMSLDVQEVM